MMELDEAIRHAEQVANEKERLGAMGRGNPDKYAPSPEKCFECAAEHRQLAEWLKELKRVRELPWLKELKELREQKRPRGEWIPVIGCDGRIIAYKCKTCGWFKPHDIMPYCENCGADMRKEGEAE